MDKKFSSSEQYVFDIINQDKEQIVKMSIVQFSEFANVSPATIVRTMKKMGYTGYTDFRHSLINSDDYARYEVLRDADDRIRDVILQNQNEVNQTIAQLDITTIEDAVQQLSSKVTIYIFARGLSEMVAEEMMLKMQLLGKSVQMFSDPNIIRKISNTIPKESIVIFVTLNGNSPELVEASKKMMNRKITSICLTTDGLSPTAQHCDIVFTGFQSGKSYFPDFDVRSRLPLQVISRILIDTLVLSLHDEQEKSTN